jgi:hypothetical protein
MFQKCIAAQLSKDLARAQLYASECAEIRKMVKIVLESQLALERAIIRLETVEQLGEILVQMLPIVSVVNETRGKIEGVIPEVASELDAVHTLLDDTVKETVIMPQREGEASIQDEEARRIFEESSLYAEEQIRRQFPELPVASSGYEGRQEAARDQPVVESWENSSDNEAIPEAEGLTENVDDEQEDLASLVYEYIKSHVKHGGKLNLTECANALGVRREDVVKAVETLHRERRIVLQ